ncbi:MAG: TlpA family protein disulfide reductase [Candidatus Cyclobacteriaceae bacterium M2_1C_046]
MYRLILISLFTTFSLCEAQVVIKGKIHNYDGETLIWYTPTLDGIYGPVGRTIKPNSNGRFKISFENEGYGTARISIKGISYRFFIDEDTKISIEIDQSKINFPSSFRNFKKYYIYDSIKQLATVSIEGDYSQINKFYNRNIRTAYSVVSEVGGNYYSKILIRENSPQKVMYLMDSLMQREIDQINILIANDDPESDANNINNEILDFLKNEVKAFYAAIFLNAMFQKRMHQVKLLKKDPFAEMKIYNRQWESLIENLSKQVQKEIDPIPGSTDYVQLVESLFYTMNKNRYKEYEYPQPEDHDQFIDHQLFRSDSVLQLNEQSLFALKLIHFKRFLENQVWYSPALLNSVYEYQRKYPESKHLDYFKPQIEKLEQYVRKASEDFNKAKVIETNYTSLSDLLEEFKGQNVLVDIWATWCLPCIKEFKNKAVLDPYISNNKLTLLYISVDKPQWEDRWRENIRYNELAGYHIRANNEFKDDLWNTIGGEKGTIPRYVLIDKKGKIYKSTASRPGDGDKLIAEIDSLIISQD